MMNLFRFHRPIVATFLVFVHCNLFTAQHTGRDSWQQPDRIMDAVGMKPGMIVGEAGAGDGYLTFHLAERVGESGHVYANDINKRVLGKIEDRCKKEKLSNITTIVGEVADPLFPMGKLDLVIMLRAFHDFTEPVEWMRNVIPSMKIAETGVLNAFT